MLKIQKDIEAELNSSDIVWGRYGSDTVEQLAARIVKLVDNQTDIRELVINTLDPDMDRRSIVELREQLIGLKSP